LLIEGDNLLALKALLPLYARRVKCVYIDPPYNTGSATWVYNDAMSSPETRDWLGQVVGAEAEDLSRHDKWLCMMYPRLALLREFLCDDGVIFVSIDDNEVGNLVGAMDEIFGPGNRMAIFTWVRKKKGSNLHKEVRRITEYVVAYRASTTPVHLYGAAAYDEKDVPLVNRSNPVTSLRFPAGALRAGAGLRERDMPSAKFGKGDLAVELMKQTRICDGVFQEPVELRGRFRWSQATVDEELAHGSVFTASRTLRINVRRWNQSEKFKALSSLLSPEDGVGTNEDATEELRRLFPEKDRLPFDYAKPSSLVATLVRAASFRDPAAIVLDSFAGSGTTGHAVLELNKADGGNRQFILVEREAAICRKVTAERLRRVIEGRTNVRPLGGGFRYCTLLAGARPLEEPVTKPVF
jgi:DNA modification methylase